MVKIIATICSLTSPHYCMGKTVISGVELTQCQISMPQLAEWMGNYPNYRLSKWKCVVGTAPTHT